MTSAGPINNIYTYICIYMHIQIYIPLPHMLIWLNIFVQKIYIRNFTCTQATTSTFAPQTDVLMNVSKLYIVIQYHICSHTYGRDLLTLRKHSKWTQVVPIGSVPINVFPDEPFLQQLAWLCGSDSLFRWWDDKFQIVSCLVSAKSSTPVLGITWHLHQTIKYLEQLMT